MKIRATVNLKGAYLDIQNMLTTCMKTNNCKSRSEGLRFVQLMKNKAYREWYKNAVFETDVKIELSSSLLPAKAVENY